LQLTAGELGHRALGEVRGADRGQGLRSTRQDLRRRRAEVLEPERDLVVHAREDDLVLRVLEERRHRAGEVRRVHAARVQPGDLDRAGEAAAVEVRHEPGQRPQQGRLPAARGPKQRDHLARLELQRDAAQRLVLAGVGERELADGR